MSQAAERYARVSELFQAALEVSPEKRAAFLARACGEDETLHREIEMLLEADAHTDVFIDEPIAALPADLLADENENALEGHAFGSYRIVRELGRGGLGTVYLAARADAAYRKEVALKLIRRGLDTDDILRRFRNERQILAQLDHPNIARLIDGGTTEGGLPYFVMEFVQGQPIDRYCTEHRLTTEQRLELFRKVCAAVTYAHQNLVVHRDLKPSNILVAAQGEPKLLDFGIAKVLSADEGGFTVTLPEQRVLTRDYASPEQIHGEKITTASDLYSLGVLLYELVSGEKPYRLKHGTSEELARAIAEQEPPRPKSIPGDLSNIVTMAMRKEPERRYASVEQLAEDVGRYLDHRPVIARKDTLAYRTAKFVRRNKAGVTAVAVVLLMLVAGAAGILRQSQIARQERDNARLAEATAQQARIRTTRLNKFLQSMLTSANPETNLGRDVKVVAVLAAASRNVDRELANEPDLRAQAHLTISRAYANLRDGEAAEKEARIALEISRRIHGDDDPATAEIMGYLGWGLQIFHRFDEAEALLRKALAVERRAAPKGEALVGILLSLSDLLVETDRAAEARPLAQEAIEMSRQTFGPDSSDVAAGVNILGNIALAEKDSAAAASYYRQSLATYRKKTPLRISYLNPLHNLVSLAIAQGHPEEAAPLLREAEEYCRENIGKNNITYGFVAGRLGLLDFLAGRYAAATEKLQHCLDDAGKFFPKDDPDMVLTRTLLGLAWTRVGQPAKGEPFLREVLAVSPNVRDKIILPWINFKSALGECLVAEGKYRAAAPLLRSGHEELEARLGPTNPRTVEVAHLQERSDVMATKGSSEGN